MAVRVYYYSDGPEEFCGRCGRSTYRWWGEGCMPLCQTCAGVSNDEQIRNWAWSNGYGPLPDGDTTRNADD